MIRKIFIKSKIKQEKKQKDRRIQQNSKMVFKLIRIYSYSDCKSDAAIKGQRLLDRPNRQAPTLCCL